MEEEIMAINAYSICPHLELDFTYCPTSWLDSLPLALDGGVWSAWQPVHWTHAEKALEATKQQAWIGPKAGLDTCRIWTMDCPAHSLLTAHLNWHINTDVLKVHHAFTLMLWNQYLFLVVAE